MLSRLEWPCDGEPIDPVAFGSTGHDTASVVVLMVQALLGMRALAPCLRPRRRQVTETARARSVAGPRPGS